MSSSLLLRGLLRQATKESLHCISSTEGTFASLAFDLHEPATSDCLVSLATEADAWNADLQSAWKSAVARELLLAGAWGVKELENVTAPFLESHPFACAAPLGDLLGHRLAVSCFPLDHGGPDDVPPWATLWLFEGTGEDMRERLSGGSRKHFDPQNRRLFFHVSRPGLETISGSSWTLAAHLANRVLEDPGPEPWTRARQLTLDWMLTGEVDGDGSLRRIDVGNKLNLRTARKWLFPVHNRGDVIGRAESLSDAWFPPTVDAAWSLLTGQGSVDGRNDVEWPRSVGSFHTFTSFAWGPIMASILLASPRRVVVWYSDEKVSTARAHALHGLLQPGFWSNSPPHVEIKEIDSGNLPNAERQLRDVLLDDLADDGEVLFNFTNGNRIMGLAPHSFAKTHSNLWLIYRDADKDQFQFELIRYKGIHPTAERITRAPGAELGIAAREVPIDVWDRLFDKKIQPPGDDADQMRHTLGGREVGKKVKFPSEIPTP